MRQERRSRQELAGMAIVISLLLIGISVGVWWNSLPPKAAPKSESIKTLADVENDLKDKRWLDVINETNAIISNSSISSRLKDAASSKKTRAELEAKSMQVYERFATAAGSGKYDQALNAYRELPYESIYSPIAREQYDQFFPLFVENKLKAAEEARGQGRCGEFQSNVQAVLNLDPKHAKALATKEQRCVGNGGSASIVVTTFEPHRKPEHVRKPRKPRAEGKTTAKVRVSKIENTTFIEP